MESYYETIADHPAVEMIQVSLDRDLGAAEKWAAEARFPWPVLLHREIPQEAMDYLTTKSIPGYVLVTSGGEVITNGREAAFSKIKSYTSR